MEGAAVMEDELWLLQRGTASTVRTSSWRFRVRRSSSCSAEIDRKHKVEGVHGMLDTGVIAVTFVCDQDDPEAPSPLLSATMGLQVGQS